MYKYTSISTSNTARLIAAKHSHAAILLLRNSKGGVRDSRLKNLPHTLIRSKYSKDSRQLLEKTKKLTRNVCAKPKFVQTLVLRESLESAEAGAGALRRRNYVKFMSLCTMIVTKR